MRRPVRLAAVAGVNLALFAVLLGGLEFGARRMAPRDLTRVFNNPELFVTGRPFVEPHPVRGFALTPGYRGPHCNVNAHGFRGEEIPEDGDPVVLAVGESTTFGWAVADHETYPSHLQTLTGSVVLNAGVPSYSSTQTALYLEELLETWDAEVVVAGAFWNDVLYSCLDNWMPELLVLRQPARWRQFLMNHSGLYRAFVLRGSDETTTPPLPAEALDLYRDNLKRMRDACERAQARLVFLLPPLSAESIPADGLSVVKDRRVTREVFHRRALAFEMALRRAAEDLEVPLIRHRLSRGADPPPTWFLDFAHPTAEGNELLAEDVARELQEARLNP